MLGLLLLPLPLPLPAACLCLCCLHALSNHNQELRLPCVPLAAGHRRVPYLPDGHTIPSKLLRNCTCTHSFFSVPWPHISIVRLHRRLTVPPPRCRFHGSEAQRQRSGPESVTLLIGRHQATYLFTACAHIHTIRRLVHTLVYLLAAQYILRIALPPRPSFLPSLHSFSLPLCSGQHRRRQAPAQTSKQGSLYSVGQLRIHLPYLSPSSPTLLQPQYKISRA